VRRPFFSRDLLQDIDLEVPIGDHLLQPAVLLLELPQPFDVSGLQRAEPLPPGVDRLIADAVLLGHLGDRPLVGLAEDGHHLLFRESGLLHGSLAASRAPFSQASAGPKIARQVKSSR
jgi:hypothetical protein